MLSNLNLKHPIIQAPMAGVSTPALAAAVSNAGGLGSLGLGSSSVEKARDAIEKTQALTELPFQVNFFCHQPAQRDAAREARWLEHLAPLFADLNLSLPAKGEEIYRTFVSHEDMQRMLLELKPAVVSFHFGLPTPSQLVSLRSAGIVTLATATNLEEARKIDKAGIDAIVAQGIEAGGHRGVFAPENSDEGLSTNVLVRLMVKETSLPVIAAGGIMDGRGIRAALNLGAVAAQLGTAFILCPESAASDGYREILKSERAHHTRMTDAISGRPARGILNRIISHGLVPHSPPPAAYPVAYDFAKQLNAAAVVKGGYEFAAHWAGQGAPLARELPAAEGTPFQPFSTSKPYYLNMTIKRLAQLPVSTYQKYISKDYNGTRGGQCAFHPSCSAFAKQEISDQGLSGLKETFYRLRRCTAETSSERMTSFLLHAAHCPEDRVKKFFTFDDPKVIKHWEKFRQQLTHSQAALSQDAPLAGAQSLSDALMEFFDKVHMSLSGELKPGETPHFYLETKRVPKPVVRANRGTVANTLRSASALVTGVMGAGLGAIGAGMGGALAGIREGFSAGAGRLPSFRNNIEHRHGAGSLSGSGTILERLDGLSHKLDPLPGRVLETAVGGAVGGALVGLAAGLGASALGLKTGWDMGRTLGVNWADEKLAKSFPTQGDEVIRKASARKTVEVPQMTTENAEKFRQMMTRIPPALQPADNGPPVSQPWSIVGLMDGTDSALERHELAKLGHFEKRTPEGVETSLHLRRGAKSSSKATLWLLAAATPLAFAAGPVAGLAAGVGLWAGLERKLEVDEKRQQELSKSDAAPWDGARTFHNAEQVASRKNIAPLKETELSTLFKERLSKATKGNVLLISGHGNGSKGIGGYQPKEVSRALDAGDRKVELGVMEGCQTATLEGLLPLQGRMRYALASQLDMDAMGLPWHHLLGNLTKLGKSPLEFAESTVGLAGGLATVPSLSLLNLDALPKVAEAVETLSDCLLEEKATDSVASALQASIHTEPEGLQRWASPRRIDLAAFLGNLEQATLSEVSTEALAAAKKALGHSVRANKSSLPLGGLSLEIPAPLQQRRYVKQTGLEKWAELSSRASK